MTKKLPLGHPVRHFIHLVLSLFELVYFQSKVYGFISSTKWESWTVMMNEQFGQDWFKTLWEDYQLKDSYSKDFQEFVSEEILRREG